MVRHHCLRKKLNALIVIDLYHFQTYLYIKRCMILREKKERSERERVSEREREIFLSPHSLTQSFLYRFVLRSQKHHPLVHQETSINSLKDQTLIITQRPRGLKALHLIVEEILKMHGVGNTRTHSLFFLTHSLLSFLHYERLNHLNQVHTDYTLYL